GCLDHRGALSFPTRRSSDLQVLDGLGGNEVFACIRVDDGREGFQYGFRCDHGVLSAKIKRYSIKCSHLSTNQKIAFDYTDPHDRSEEHTSELQSRENLVCRL